MKKRLANNLYWDSSSKSYIVFTLQIIPSCSLQYFVFLTVLKKLDANVRLIIVLGTLNNQTGLEWRVIFWPNF